MSRTMFRRRVGRLVSALATLSLLLSLVALAVPATQAGEGDGPPATPLVPNVEPAGEGDATLAAAETMEDRIAAVLAEFNALPQPAQPPEGALPRLDVPATAAAAPMATHRLYMPMMMRRADPAQAPDPGTPTPGTPTPEPEPESDPADVAVVLWPKPSIWVKRGDLLAYEIRLYNYGKGDAKETKVTLPYNRQQFTLAYTSLASSKGDWVSAIEQNSFTVTFSKLAEGQQRTGTVYLRVGANVAQAAVIDMRARYTFRDGDDGGSGKSNWAPVLVGSGNTDGSWLWLEVAPLSGRAGTTHAFYTDRFIPGEGIVTWLNTPDGVKALDLRGTADSYGRIRLEFSSKGLKAGNYSMVLYGSRSKMTAVGAFVVQP